MIVPPGTTCPPNALNPSRCEFESRPFLDVPCPFLCAIYQVLSGQLPVLRCEGKMPNRDSRPGGRRCLLLLRLRLCLRLSFGGCLHLLRLRFFLRKIGSLEALSPERDLRDAHRRKWL